MRYNDPTGHCVFATSAGAGSGWTSCGSGAIGIGLAYRTAAVVGAGGAGYIAGEVIKELNADEQPESFPLPQPSQPSVTGFPTITAEDDGLLTTPGSPAPGMNVLTEPGAQQQEVGSNIVAANIVQSGGRTFSQDAADILNEVNGVNYHRREYGRALEKLKKFL